MVPVVLELNMCSKLALNLELSCPSLLSGRNYGLTPQIVIVIVIVLLFTCNPALTEKIGKGENTGNSSSQSKYIFHLDFEK